MPVTMLPTPTRGELLHRPRPLLTRSWRARVATGTLAGLLPFLAAACTQPTPPPPTQSPEEIQDERQQIAERENDEDLTPIALVDGVCVLTRGQLEAQLNRLADRYEESIGRSRVTPQWRDERRQHIIDSAIHDTLIHRYLSARGPLPTEEETLAQLRALNPNVFGNPDIFERYLASQQQSREEFLHDQAIEMALLDALRSRGLAPPTEEELLAFLRDHEDRMRAGERILLSSITIPYQDPSSDHELQQSLATLRQTRAALLDGTLSFDEASRTFNQSSELSNHEELGWVQRGDDRLLRHTGIEDTLFSAPVGFISEPTTSSQGVHIFIVQNRRPEGTRQLDEVRESLTQPLMHRKRRHAREALLQELRSEALIEINERDVAWETREIPPETADDSPNADDSPDADDSPNADASPDVGDAPDADAPPTAH